MDAVRLGLYAPIVFNYEWDYERICALAFDLHRREWLFSPRNRAKISSTAVQTQSPY